MRVSVGAPSVLARTMTTQWGFRCVQRFAMVPKRAQQSLAVCTFRRSMSLIAQQWLPRADRSSQAACMRAGHMGMGPWPSAWRRGQGRGPGAGRRLHCLPDAHFCTAKSEWGYKGHDQPDSPSGVIKIKTVRTHIGTDTSLPLLPGARSLRPATPLLHRQVLTTRQLTTRRDPNRPAYYLYLSAPTQQVATASRRPLAALQPDPLPPPSTGIALPYKQLGAARGPRRPLSIAGCQQPCR